MAVHDGAEHHFFRKLLGFGFNHQHCVRRTGNHEIEDGVLHLVERRVENVFAVNVADAGAAHRAHERHARERQRRRGRNHRDDIRIVLEIVAENRHHDLRVVAVAFNEERANRAVDQAGNQRFLLRRAPFALEEAAGNAASREGLFLIVDREREEIDTRLRLLGRNDGRENGSLAIAGKHGAIGLARDAASFERQRATGPFNGFALNIKHFLILFGQKLAPCQPSH